MARSALGRLRISTGEVLNNVADALRQTASVANNNATQQEQASA